MYKHFHPEITDRGLGVRRKAISQLPAVIVAFAFCMGGQNAHAQVGAIPTTTALGLSTPSVASGEAVALTAAVAPPTPGVITFYDGRARIATAESNFNVRPWLPSGWELDRTHLRHASEAPGFLLQVLLRHRI